MKSLSHLSVKMSWTLVLLAFLALLIALSAMGLYAVNHSQRSFDTFSAVNVSQQAALNRANSMLQSVRIDMAGVYEELLESSVAGAGAHGSDAHRLGERLEAVTDNFNLFLELPVRPEHAALMGPIEASFNAMMESSLLPQAEALAAGDLATYQALRDWAAAANAGFYQAAVGFFHQVEAEGAERAESFGTVVTTAQRVIVLVFIVALIVIGVVYRGVSASLIGPLDRIVQHFQRMASGDLSAPVESHGKNEIGKLFAALATMQQGLATTVATVRDSSAEILSNSREIASGNRDLAARTERQSASLTETASSMEEMTSTMERNSENASLASEMAREAAQRADRGGDVVANVVSRMEEIRESSQRVTEIIGLMDSIAFQTNILALNASVEAARAGEHGRGFAVVANEVRKLATRSADAATEIRQLIETSVRQVEAGTQQADSASSTMGSIMASVQRVNELMNEIAVASNEQRSGIGEVNTAVGDMDHTTQQNAALVEQASLAASQLQAEAQRLDEAVARFKLADGSREADTMAALPSRAEAQAPRLVDQRGLTTA
ncbi:methyl-accepting chemotaxis protein [Halomonas sp. A29]|uniref:methyl-accepting chemotaxis protein n=1 Tax=Halomonas sp. A29 TaxID=3102786 RepID=UPI00398B42E3